MTVRLAYENNITETDAHIWPCAHCGRIYLQAGAALLTFALDEFETLTEAVSDCYYHSKTLTQRQSQLAGLLENENALASTLAH